jgi:benzoyl-CoA reductase subunit C
VSSGGAEDALRFAGRTSLDPARAVSRWKALTGRKAAGCLPLFIPEEILHAAGMLPVTVFGDEYRDLPASGRWDVLDGWVLPPAPVLSSEFAKSLPESASGRPQVSLRFTPGRMKAPSTEETLDRVELLREWAGDTAGRPATDGALERSISVFNENRRLVLGLQNRLAAIPGAFSAVEVFLLFRSAMALPREAHTELLRAALSRDPGNGRRSPVRVFLAGVTASRALMEAIDDAGAVLVGEAMAAGNRTHEALVDDRGDPALALARRLRAQLLELAEAGAEPSFAARMLDRVQASGANRFFYVGTDAAIPDAAGRLAAEAGRRGIPFLFLECDLAAPTPERQKERIASFLATGGKRY